MDITFPKTPHEIATEIQQELLKVSTNFKIKISKNGIVVTQRNESELTAPQQDIINSIKQKYNYLK